MTEEWDDDTTATGAEDVVPPRASTIKRACFTVLTGTTVGKIFKLAAGACAVGRAPHCEVRLPDEGISRAHAGLRIDGDDVWITDEGSRNGTYVNGERVTGPTLLADGDKVQIGRTTVLRFAYHDELDESFHESLMASALRDPQTRLYNKRYLLDRLDGELKFARRHDTVLSVIMLDIDHFKAVNDNHGHLAGDAVLANLAKVLADAVRHEDVVARFGGEELAIILRAIGIDQAAQLGERLRRIVESTTTAYQGKVLRATVSIGVAGYPAAPAETVEQLLDSADRALYRAKRAGRNRVMRCTERDTE